MAIIKICKCGDSASYHQVKQSHDQDGNYVSREYLECLMDGCDCQQFEQVKEAVWTYNIHA